VEGAGGLGWLLAQLLVTAGERVLGVPPELASRVRLLQAGDTTKNDPHDARSVAVAALRPRARRGDSRRPRCGFEDLAQAAPGPVPLAQPGRLPAARRAAAWPPAVTQRRSPQPRLPGSWGRSRRWAVASARAGLAAEFLAGLRHLDAPLRDTRTKLAAAVRASGTTVTQLFGAGPILGMPATCPASPARSHFAACNGTAPGRGASGNRKTYRLPLCGNRRPYGPFPPRANHPSSADRKENPDSPLTTNAKRSGVPRDFRTGIQ
jgi:transposase